MTNERIVLDASVTRRRAARWTPPTLRRARASVGDVAVLSTSRDSSVNI